MTSQIERVTESQNAKKFKEMMGKATDWASKCTKEDVFNYVGAFIGIFDILQTMWTGGCIVKDTGNTGGAVDPTKLESTKLLAANFLSRKTKTFDQLKAAAATTAASSSATSSTAAATTATSSSANMKTSPTSITLISSNSSDAKTKIIWREDTLFCLFLTGMMDSFKTSKALFDNTLKKTFSLIDTKIRSGITEAGWQGNILFYIMAGGFVAFIGLLVYALYSYINMSYDDHDKIKEDLRKKYRKRSTRKYK